MANNQEYPNSSDDMYNESNHSNILEEINDSMRYYEHPIDADSATNVAQDISVFRSVGGGTMVHPQFQEHDVRPSFTLERPSLTKNYSDSKNITVVPATRYNHHTPCFHVTNNTNNNQLSNPFVAPISSTLSLAEKPSFIFKSHIVCDMRLDLICSQVTDALERNGEISYEFNKTTCQWTGAYTRGTSFCKFTINVYSDSPRGYIVEAQRLKGDCPAFHVVFRAINSVLTPNTEISRYDSFNTASPLNGCYETRVPVGDDDAQAALQAVVNMTKSTKIEARLEACKMICDLSYHNESLEHLRDSGCVEVLVELLAVGCPCTQRNAILALSNLSESHSCQEAIVESGILPSLFGYCVDGPYLTSETRRACARLLANISARMAGRIVDKFDATFLNKWMQSVEAIDDSKIRLHANRAKSAIQRAVAV